MTFNKNFTLVLAIAFIASTLCIGQILAMQCQYKTLEDVQYDGESQLSDYFDLKWRIFDNETIEITMEADNQDGWFAIGIDYGSNGMDMADCYMGYTDQGTQTAELHDKWLEQIRNAPKDDTDIGGEENILSCSAESDGTRGKIRFTRKLDTGDSKDKKIEDKDIGVSFAMNTGTQDLSQAHTNKGKQEKFNFYGLTGKSTGNSPSAHGFLTLTNQVLIFSIGTLAILIFSSFY